MGIRGRVRSRGLVPGARAYLAGAGTTGSLLAVAALVFIVASALVAFRGWPHVAAATSPGEVVVSRAPGWVDRHARSAPARVGRGSARGGRSGSVRAGGWRGWSSGALCGGTRARATEAAAPCDRRAREHVGPGERFRCFDVPERMRDTGVAVAFAFADPGPASPADPLAGDEHARKRRVGHGQPARVDGAADHERRRGRARGVKPPVGGTVSKVGSGATKTVTGVTQALGGVLKSLGH